MLVFITSLRHPDNCVSYPRMLELVAACLRSVTAQRDPRFRAIVVCNRRPALPDFPRTDFVEVDFPPPNDVRGRQELPVIRFDRGSKLAVGLLHARRYAPTHVLLHDCDDLLSARLAGFVGAHPRADGWHCERGWAWSQGRRLLRPLGNFHKLNGSAHILAADLLALPEDLTVAVSQEELRARLDPFFLLGVIGAHLVRSEYCATIGRPLAPLPFPSTVYVRDTGENQCPKPPMLGTVPIDAELSAEFALPRPAPDPVADARERLEAGWARLRRLGKRVWQWP